MIRALVNIFRRIFDPEPGPWPFACGEPVEVDVTARTMPGYYYTCPARVIRCTYRAMSRTWFVELHYEIPSQKWPETVCPAALVRSCDPIRALSRLA